MPIRTFVIVCNVLAGLGLVGTALDGFAAPPPADSVKIKKCQDATGKWHYGDTADEACHQSKIIEINKRGVETREIAAPLTEEERKAKELEQAEKEKEAQLAAERKLKDKILLSTYTSEADITAMRERKLAEIDVQIRGSQATLKTQQDALARLQTKAKAEGSQASPQTQANIGKTEAAIAKQQAFIQAKQQEQEIVKQRFQADLERYRQLKTQPTDTLADTPTDTLTKGKYVNDKKCSFSYYAIGDEKGRQLAAAARDECRRNEMLKTDGRESEVSYEAYNLWKDHRMMTKRATPPPVPAMKPSIHCRPDYLGGYTCQ